MREFPTAAIRRTTDYVCVLSIKTVCRIESAEFWDYLQTSSSFKNRPKFKNVYDFIWKKRNRWYKEYSKAPGWWGRERTFVVNQEKQQLITSLLKKPQQNEKTNGEPEIERWVRSSNRWVVIGGSNSDCCSFGFGTLTSPVEPGNLQLIIVHKF